MDLLRQTTIASDVEMDSGTESDGDDEFNAFSFDSGLPVQLMAEPEIREQVVKVTEIVDEDVFELDVVKEKAPLVQKNNVNSNFFVELPQSHENAQIIDNFTSLSISRPLLKAVAKLGYITPTPVQAKTIPLALEGRDLCVSAVTGSGKTAAFIVPILERLMYRQKNGNGKIRVLILVPTRELASQVRDVGMGLAEFTDVIFCMCVGGMPIKPQQQELRLNPDIVIATPGRLIDHLQNSPSFNLDSIEILVMDEADRMLSEGFHAELTEIIKNTPKKRQTLLFSATMTDNVQELIQLSLTRPIRLHVDSNNAIASKLVQEFVRVRGNHEKSRPAFLAALCSRTYTSKTIIFFKHKAQAHLTNIIFKLLGLNSAELHGNLTQPQRVESLELFRTDKVDFLLCTDLASRGLDIPGVKTVINYDMPQTYQVYVHRVGRTARASMVGRAVSLVGEEGRLILKQALENSVQNVKHRIIPAPVLQKYEEMIDALDDQIKEVFQQERRIKEIDGLEMKVSRAQNMIEHEQEIMSRPKRTWFQSESERIQAQEPSNLKNERKPKVVKNESAILKNGSKRGKFDGLSRHKKRLKSAREEDAGEAKAQKSAARVAKKGARLTKISTTTTNSKSGKPAKKGNSGKLFSTEKSQNRK